MSRDARHTKHLPTKEIFYQVVYGIAAKMVGAWAGYDIDADGEYAYITCYLPRDFDALEEIRLVFLATATETPMNFRIVTDYAKAGQAYFEHNELENFNVNTVLNRIQELDLEGVVDIRPLEPGDYIGVQVTRQAGQNTDMLVLGVRIKYKYR